MQFITHLFRGELISILIGHPDFEVLFTVEHIARIGFIENPSAARALVMEDTEGYGFVQLCDISQDIKGSIICNPHNGKEGSVWLASAAETYRVLLRAGSPSASTFRGLVTRQILPDVREIDRNCQSYGTSDLISSESARMALTIRILERDLAAERRHAEKLKKIMKIDHEHLLRSFNEIASLRKGMPHFEKQPAPEGLLERMQWEQDQQALPWLRELKETEVSLCRVDTEEELWRSPREREKREEFARTLRKE